MVVDVDVWDTVVLTTVDVVEELLVDVVLLIDVVVTGVAVVAI